MREKASLCVWMHAYTTSCFHTQYGSDEMNTVADTTGKINRKDKVELEGNGNILLSETDCDDDDDYF